MQKEGSWEQCSGWVSGSPLPSLLGHVLLHFHPSRQGGEASIPPTSRALLLVDFANTLNALK